MSYNIHIKDKNQIISLNFLKSIAPSLKTSLEFPNLLVCILQDRWHYPQKNLSLFFSDDQTRLYKEVLRTSRNFDKISAYGLVYVDVKLPISVIGLLTGYVVVLLQLNLL